MPSASEPAWTRGHGSRRDAASPSQRQFGEQYGFANGTSRCRAPCTALLDVDPPGGRRPRRRALDTGPCAQRPHRDDAALRARREDKLWQLTALEDPVSHAAYLPGTRTAVIGSDRGGDERHQLSIIDLETARANGPRRSGDLDKLTDDPRFGHQLAGVSPDGGLIAYVANRRNGVDFDVWVCDVASREHRCVYDGGGWCQPATGFSPDARYLSSTPTWPTTA